MIPGLQPTEDRRVRHRYSLSKTPAIACAITLGLTLAAIAAPPAASALGPDAPADLTARDVELLRPKTSIDFSAVYPGAAFREGIEGEALVRCIVDTDLRLSDCRVVRETPSGQGFGEATIRVAMHLRLKGTTLTGEPTPGRGFLFPLKFRLPR